MKQLSLFDEPETSDAYPLPVIVARKWQFSLSRHEQDGEYWYCLIDWYSGLLNSNRRQAQKSVSRYFKDGPSIVYRNLPYTSNDGKLYRVKFTNGEGIYRCTLDMRPSPERPLIQLVQEVLCEFGVLLNKGANSTHQNGYDWYEAQRKGAQRIVNDFIDRLEQAKKGFKIDNSGYVYLLKSSTGAYKIGRSKNPENRLLTFTVKLPFEVEYVALIKTNNPSALERKLQKRFQHRHIDGEWFELTKEDVEYIKGLQS